MIATAVGDPAAAPRRVVSRINPANAVTASRFLTLPPLVWAIANGHHQWATLFVVICGVLDKVDGLAARIFDCRSVFGEVFDAITDGICYGFALVLVCAYGWAPVIPVIVLVGLGLVNSALRAVYIKRAGRTVNYKSYAMERVVGFVAYLIGFATGGFEVQFMYWIFVPLFIVVCAWDAKRMLLDPIPPPDPAESAEATP